MCWLSRNASLNYKIMQSFIGFSIAGLTATICNYSIFLVLMSLNVHYLLSGCLGYISGIGVSYFINVKFFFKKSSGYKVSGMKYFIFYLLSIINYTVVFYFISNFMDSKLANILAIIIAFIMNFALMKKFVFEHEAAKV